MSGPDEGEPSMDTGSDPDSGGPSMDIDNSSTVIKKIANIYAERLMSDICLVVNRVEYPSHRLILCASSDVFQVMLMNQHWTESQEKRIVLVESTACAAVFEHFLRYLYTGKILLDYSTVVPLVNLADKYNIKDLLKLGIDYMLKNVSTASKRNQLVSWFQFAVGCGHKPLASKCHDFIKWNFEIVSKTIDFVNLELEQLVVLLKCHDLVVKNEVTVFECVHRWLKGRKCQMIETGEEHIDVHMSRFFQILLPLIRFPMMTKVQLDNLNSMEPFSSSFTVYLGHRISYALNLKCCRGREMDQRLYTPRLYTEENFCTSHTIEYMPEVPLYHCRSIFFSSCTHTSEDVSEWYVDIFPKGVCFQECLTVYVPPKLVVPGRIIETVRVSVFTKQVVEQRVRIGILVAGNQDDYEHIRRVSTKNFFFGPDDPYVNFDDVIDFEEMTQFKSTSPFLTGPGKDCLKIYIVIVPLTEFSLL